LQKTRFNHQIKAPEVRAINDRGEQIGVLKLSEALALAEEQGVDLVEIAPNAKPPVVKLIDLAKFKYQQKKQEQQQKKRQKKTEVKTIRLSVRISDHDIGIKAKKASEFLEYGNWVRIELRMRGREQAFGNLGEGQIKKFLSFVTIPHKIETPIKRMGPTFTATITPVK